MIPLAPESGEPAPVLAEPPAAPAGPDEDAAPGDGAGLVGEQALTEAATISAASEAAVAATLRENDMVSILPPRSHNFRRQGATGLVTGHHSTGRNP
jgi:hypothetical protein